MRSKAVVLTVANAAACLLFVLLREPVAADCLAELDAVQRRGGMVVNSGISGMVACRDLYPWSEWHGGEALGVKILEAANLPAVIVTAVVHLGGTVAGAIGSAERAQACYDLRSCSCPASPPGILARTSITSGGG